MNSLSSELGLLHDIVSVDSVFGIQAFGKPAGRIEVYDANLYGDRDMLNDDCPQGGLCLCKEKQGMMAPNFGVALTTDPMNSGEMLTIK